MAAGIGRRYGGLKQLEPVGPSGEHLVDYSAYDAIRAGFARIVFVIRKDIEDEFRRRLGRRIEGRVDVAYVFQTLDELPSGLAEPEGRIKPWGTGHALLCCAQAVQAPFAAINADDFYGASTFAALRGFLASAGAEAGHYCMVGFPIEKTLTSHGTVSRGICSVDGEGYLMAIDERTRIRGSGGGAEYTEDGSGWIPIPKGVAASMNAWGFNPSFFGELSAGFARFLRSPATDPCKDEFALPGIVGQLVAERMARVRVIPSEERWYGVTYREDGPELRRAVRGMVERGTYPSPIWGG